MQESKIIFDSRRASNVYKMHTHYRSGGFTVPAGHVALVELTTKHDIVDKIVFTAIRTPVGFGVDCFDLDGIGKRYRQVECSGTLPFKSTSREVSSSTTHTPYQKSIWRLGNDMYNGEVHEYRHILRPGDYYLIADKKRNSVIEQCDIPTVIEVSIFPANHVSTINESCGE